MSEIEVTPDGEVLVPLEAEYVGPAGGDWSGDAVLWKLNRTATLVRFNGERIEFSYVVTSAVQVMFIGPETYAFPSTPKGKVKSWAELPGSQRGDITHETVIEGFCKGFRDGQEEA